MAAGLTIDGHRLQGLSLRENSRENRPGESKSRSKHSERKQSFLALSTSAPHTTPVRHRPNLVAIRRYSLFLDEDNTLLFNIKRAHLIQGEHPTRGREIQRSFPLRPVITIWKTP